MLWSVLYTLNIVIVNWIVHHIDLHIAKLKLVSSYWRLKVDPSVQELYFTSQGNRNRIKYKRLGLLNPHLLHWPAFPRNRTLVFGYQAQHIIFILSYASTNTRFLAFHIVIIH